MEQRTSTRLREHQRIQYIRELQRAEKWKRAEGCGTAWKGKKPQSPDPIQRTHTIRSL